MNWEELAGIHVVDAKYENGDITMTLQSGVELVTIKWSPEGDCCSSSWIEHIEGIENLKGQTILESRCVDGPRDEADSEHDVLQIYFYKLRTTAGYVDIDMHNSSNGYYGGYLTFEILSRHDKNGKSLSINHNVFNIKTDIIRYVSNDVIENYKR